MTYTVEKESRRRWAYVVRMNKGYAVARCDSQKDADKIAEALNAAERRPA